MNETAFKIVVEMGWEFIVSADTEDEAMNKLGTFLDSLFIKDGFSRWTYKAKENINKSEYSIALYDGFIVN